MLCYHSLSLPDKPYGEAEISPMSVEMAEGATEILHCTPPHPPGNPSPSWFAWLEQNGTFHENTTSAQLEITPEYVNESRLYQCVAGNYMGTSGASQWANITVLSEFQVIDHVFWYLKMWIFVWFFICLYGRNASQNPETCI